MSGCETMTLDSILNKSLIAAFAALTASASAQDCTVTSVGVRPLDDLGVHDYQGFQGGLYPGGVNVRPSAHDAAGLQLARQIVALDKVGNPAVDGKIGLACIGFSLARMPFQEFMGLASGDHSIDPRVAFANCGVSGAMLDLLADADSSYWTSEVPNLLAAAGVAARQVQVIWLSCGVRTETESFPTHAFASEDLILETLHVVHATFPNAKLVFVSSMPYLGYSVVQDGFEPFYYEQAFALKWLIERQIQGDPALNYDASLGPVGSPWLTWGPYFFSDGLVPRSDGLVWECADVLADGTHPSKQGKHKLANLLMHSFKSDPVATIWFLASAGAPAGRQADVNLFGEGTTGTLGEPLLTASGLPTIPTGLPFELRTNFASPGSSGLVLIGASLFDEDGIPFAGGQLYVDWNLTLPVVFDASGVGSLSFGSIPNDPGLYGLTAFAQLAAFDPNGLDGRFALSSGLELVLGD